MLIIQSVTIGNEIKKRSNTEITDPFPSELKNSNPPQNISVDKEKYLTKQTTQTTIYYDIWDVKKGVSVFVVEASVVLVDGLNHKDPYLSIEKVTEALINKISGKEK